MFEGYDLRLQNLFLFLWMAKREKELKDFREWLKKRSKDARF